LILCGAGIGYAETLALPWTEALRFARAAARLRRAALYEDSLAARAAQADRRGWKAWERAANGEE
jgi:hypothetical protein